MYEVRKSKSGKYQVFNTLWNTVMFSHESAFVCFVLIETMRKQLPKYLADKECITCENYDPDTLCSWTGWNYNEVCNRYRNPNDGLMKKKEREMKLRDYGIGFLLLVLASAAQTATPLLTDKSHCKPMDHHEFKRDVEGSVVIVYVDKETGCPSVVRQPIPLCFKGDQDCSQS